MMKIVSLLLVLVGIVFCIVALMGHAAAWAATALCFFAAAMVVVGKRKK